MNRSSRSTACSRDLSSRQTAYNRIKRYAKRPSRQHLELLIDQIAWLDEFCDFSLAVAGIPASKQVEDLVGLLDGVVDILADESNETAIAGAVRKLLAPKRDLGPLRESCAAIRAFSGRKHLPLHWKHFKAHRSVMMRVARTLEWDSTSPVRSLMNALDAVLEYESLHRGWIDADVDVSFAAPRWRKLVRRSHGDGSPTNRRYLELCVFSYMAEKLWVGDLCVPGSDAYADYRDHLLPWRQCERQLPDSSTASLCPARRVGARRRSYRQRACKLLPGQIFWIVDGPFNLMHVSVLHIWHYDGFPLDPLPETCSDTSRASTIAG